jgi:hypothetical protein
MVSNDSPIRKSRTIGRRNEYRANSRRIHPSAGLTWSKVDSDGPCWRVRKHSRIVQSQAETNEHNVDNDLSLKPMDGIVAVYITSWSIVYTLTDELFVTELTLTFVPPREGAFYVSKPSTHLHGIGAEKNKTLPLVVENTRHINFFYS